jgi:hypothetical protein
MKGWRTMAFGAATAIVPALLTYAAGIDWTKLGINPMLAGILGAAIIGLRAVTSTPVGRSDS